MRGFVVRWQRDKKQPQPDGGCLQGSCSTLVDIPLREALETDRLAYLELDLQPDVLAVSGVDLDLLVPVPCGKPFIAYKVKMTDHECVPVGGSLQMQELMYDVVRRQSGLPSGRA